MTQGGSKKPRRRLAALEDRRPAPPPPDRTEARRRMKAFPDRLLEAQRGNLGKEEAAEVRATAEAILERGAEMRESRGGPSLMARCAGIKRGGGQCTTVVRPPQTHCYQHDPARSEERRRNASRAGKGAGGREIRGLKRRISEVVDAVLEGSQDRGRAAVAI